MDRATPRSGDSLISGAFAAVGGQAIAYLIGFPTSILIARALGPDGRGEYYLPVITAMAAMAIFQISLDTANQVATSEHRIGLGRLMRSANALALLVTPIAMAAMVGFFLLARSTVFDGVELGDYLIAVATVPFGVHLVWLVGLLTMAHRIVRTQVAMVTGPVVYLVAATILYAYDELGVTQVLTLYAVSVALPWVLNLLWARELGSLLPSFEPAALRRLIGIALRFHPAHLALYMLLKIDVFLVGGFLDVEDVGVYSLAVLFAEPLFVATGSLVQASVPFQVARSQRDAARLAFKAARFSLALSLAASLLMVAGGWFLIPAIFGAGFEDSYAALVLLLPGVCALSCARPFLTVLPRTGRARRYLSVAMGGFALNCALNVVLLPAVGIIGASIASSIAYGLVTALFLSWGLKLADLPARAALLPQPDDRETWHRISSRLRFWRRTSG